MATKPPDLPDEVRLMLDAVRGEWPEIAAQSGVSYSWLSKFSNGHIPNPGYETLRGLRDYLVSRQASAN